MLNFYNSTNLSKNKRKLHKNFLKSSNNIIHPKINPNDLKISSYNIHYFSKPLLSQNKTSLPEISKNISNLLNYIQQSQPDIVLLQETLYNNHILQFFKQYRIIHCSTYSFKTDYTYYFGNITLIINPNIIIKDEQKIKIKGYFRPKCCINTQIKFNNHKISIYNIHLDAWDKTGQTRINQLTYILDLIKKDKTKNIILAGDFNSIIESNYQKPNILTKIYQNPFKEIEIIKNNFNDAAQYFIKKPTVWSKQRVDFFFVNKSFNIPIINYNTDFYKGSDHYPISITLKTSNNCLKILNNPIIEKPINMNTPQELNKVVYKFNHKGCEIVIKILPIWRKNWNIHKEKLKEYKISNTHIQFGKNAAKNELEMNKLVSQLVENNISYCFTKTIAAYKTNYIPINNFQLKNIPNQEFLILIQPKYDFDTLINLPDLITFQLQWALYTSYKLLNFVHGDIYHSGNNNCFFQNYVLENKKYAIFRDEENYWRFPINGILPTIVMFDFEFSDIDDIHTKIPFTPITEYPIGKMKTMEKKREYDIMGLNIVLEKIGIKNRIPIIPLKNNQKLLNGYDNYKINKSEAENTKDYIMFFSTF